MSTFKAIRQCLGVTQAEMSRALDMSQGNISFLERGQTVTPDVAKKLIAYAATLGYALTYDQIYGAAPLPAPRILEAASKAA
jgi:putative transcriptional regulator